MFKRHPKTYRNILALVVLGGTALFAVYYLYFRSPVTNGSHEIVARQIEADPSTTISSKVTYRFSDEEKTAAFNRSSTGPTPDLDTAVTDATDPGFTIVPSQAEIPPSSSNTMITPSPLDAPQSKVSLKASNSTPSPDTPENESSGPLPPVTEVESMMEQVPPDREVADEKIPHIGDTGTTQPITKILTAEDDKTEKLADLPLKEDSAAQSPASPDEKAIAKLPRENSPGNNASSRGSSSPDEIPSSTVTDPKPVEATNEVQHPKSKSKSLKDNVWVINVLSTQNEKRQWELFKILSHYPYRVYTYTAEVKGKEWKRIRIGFFPTKEEAMAAGQKIARKHKLPQPWIVRPGPEEMEKFYLE